MHVQLNRPAFSGHRAMSRQQAQLVAQRNGLDMPGGDAWDIPAGAVIHLQDLANAHAAQGRKPLEPATKQLATLAALAGATVQGDWPETWFTVK